MNVMMKHSELFGVRFCFKKLNFSADKNCLTLTNWKRVILEESAASLVKNLLVFYGSRKLVSVLTKARLWGLF